MEYLKFGNDRCVSWSISAAGTLLANPHPDGLAVQFARRVDAIGELGLVARVGAEGILGRGFERISLPPGDIRPGRRELVVGNHHAIQDDVRDQRRNIAYTTRTLPVLEPDGYKGIHFIGKVKVRYDRVDTFSARFTSRCRGRRVGS